MVSYAMPSPNSHPSPDLSAKRSQDLSDQEAGGRWSGGESDGDLSRDGSTTKRRKRDDYSHRPVSVSCETCKLRKVKCDRGQPSCSWCLKNRQICEYKERKKPGLRAGYGRELEAKLAEQGKLLERIQDVLLRHETTLTQLISKSTNGSPTPHSPASSVAYVQSDNYRQKPSKDVSQLQTFSSYIPVGGSNATSADPSHYNRSTYPQHFYSDESGRRIADSFPDRDICHGACDAYFKYINRWLPILPQDATFKSLFRVPPHLLDPSEQVLLHAIIASSLRFHPDVRLSDDVRRRHEQFSTERVELYSLHHNSIAGLQSLLIVTLGVVGDQGVAAASTLMSLLIKSAIQMGLTREIGTLKMEHIPSHAPKPRDFMEEESQRRLMWGIYVMDRLSTFGTSAISSLPEHVERRLPCHDEYFFANRYIETPWLATEEQNKYMSSQGLGPFCYLVEIVSILTSIDNFLRVPTGSYAHEGGLAKWRCRYEGLDKQLTNWYNQLPNYYKIPLAEAQTRPEGYDVNLPLIQALGYTATIRLHFDVAFSDSKASLGHTVSPTAAATRCHSAAENILQTLDFVRTRKILSRMGPFFATSLAVAQQVFLAQTESSSRNGSPLCPLAFSPNYKDKSRLRSLKLASDPRVFVLGNGLVALAEDWPIAAGFVDCDDFTSPIRPQTGSANSIDQLKDPRLPTGFDRILDSGPRKQEHSQHSSPGHSHVPPNFIGTPPQDSRAQWVQQQR